MKRLTDRLPLVVIAVMGMAYGIMSLMMPLLGDDMGYAHNYFTNYQGVADLPLIMGRHWYHVNSRMADMLNSVWFGMIPRWMLALMCGLMVVGYFQLTARCAHIKSASGRTILATLLVFTMPWWDSFFLFVCQFNYVWSSVMVLFILGFVTARINLIGWWQWVAVPVALIAGWMHEAAGLPAAFGLMVWMVTCHKLVSLSPARGWSIVTFCIGAAMSATSPASWNRAAHVEPNDPMWLLLLKSDFYALALVVVIIYLIAYRRTTLINAI
ncbi:MAG: hypothetical protein K2M65_00705, partial [Muribaculaceae bacterium]|nr:hypothetical protein [Muribaculaceae bacterium]